jgi:hypothetical protein
MSEWSNTRTLGTERTLAEPLSRALYDRMQTLTRASFEHATVHVSEIEGPTLTPAPHHPEFAPLSVRKLPFPQVFNPLNLSFQQRLAQCVILFDLHIQGAFRC